MLERLDSPFTAISLHLTIPSACEEDRGTGIVGPRAEREAQLAPPHEPSRPHAPHHVQCHFSDLQRQSVEIVDGSSQGDHRFPVVCPKESAALLVRIAAPWLGMRSEIVARTHAPACPITVGI